MSHTCLEQLSDDALVLEVKRLACSERRATAALIRSLIEFDARRLYLSEGCSSLFTYCTQVLHLSEGGAYNRIEAARAARKFPMVLDALEEGSITLTTIRLLGPHLTEGNHRSVLAAVHRQSKREVERMVAELNPKSDAASLIRTVPDTVSPLAPGRYQLRVSISQDTYEKLLRAQDLLRHTKTHGDLPTVIDRGVTMLLQHLERRRFAESRSPRTSCQLNVRSRYIPATVRREVWRRDRGQCAFVGVAGRCAERGFLEFHHVDPYALGGPSTVENIQLRCRAHNQHEANERFWWDAPGRYRRSD